MANFLNYLEKNQKSFTEEAFNIVDSLILAYLSYLHFPSTKTKLKDLSVLKSAKTKKNKELNGKTLMGYNEKMKVNSASCIKVPIMLANKLNY